MNVRGPVLHPHTAAPQSRRSLILAAGAAGLAGAAAWVAGSVKASTDVPTEDDTLLLFQAMALELTARDLYRETLGAGIDDETAVVVEAMATNHGAYAQSIAGAAGLSASTRAEEVFEALQPEFATSDFELAAHGLEQSAVATHTALLGQYESGQAIALTASILVVEARHATVLADLAGVEDLDTLFGNDAEPLDLRTEIG